MPVPFLHVCVFAQYVPVFVCVRSHVFAYAQCVPFVYVCAYVDVHCYVHEYFLSVRISFACVCVYLFCMCVCISFACGCRAVTTKLTVPKATVTVLAT